jgi:CubicO group peptidase (beta-lactamase class C family)
LALLLAGCGGGGEPLLPLDAAWCSAAAARVDPLPDLYDGVGDLDAVTRDYVDGERYSSGIAIATVNGEEVQFHVAGSARWDADVAVDPDTAFELGSITKVFTSLLLADAVVRGEVALDDAANAYLPLEGQLPSRDGVPVALWHLATHTAGLPRDASGFTPGPYDDWYLTYTAEEFHRALRGVHLASRSGTHSSYSNMGAALLGYLLTRRTGQSYEELLRTRILTPLGMSSTYLYDAPEGLHLATPYHHRDVETDYFMVPAGLEGAGRIRSTARDLARFARAALGLDRTPLDAAFALAEAEHFKGPGDGAEVEYGLGWGRGHSGGALFLAHGGGT